MARFLAVALLVLAALAPIPGHAQDDAGAAQRGTANAGDADPYKKPREIADVEGEDEADESTADEDEPLA